MKLTRIVFAGLALCIGSAHFAAAQDSAEGASAWPWADPDTEETVTVLLLGDTNIMEREDPAEPFRFVLPTLRAADLRYANLEGPFAGTSEDPRVPDIAHKGNWRHSEPAMAEGLVAAGIDAVGVANNVTYPWQALLRSLDVLEAHGIPYTGGGNDLDAAHRPVILEVDGVRFGFIQYTTNFWPYQHAATDERPGVATVKIETWYQPPTQVLDKPGQPPIVRTEPDPDALARMVDDIRRLDPQVDVLVASYHWGVSGQTEIEEYQRTLAHAAIEAGADIIHGHGPHVFQPVEIYEGQPILYSLANFAFDWEAVRDKPYGLLARGVVENGVLTSLSLVPLRRDAENHVLMLDPNEDIGRELYEDLVEISATTGVELSLVGQEIRIGGLGKAGASSMR